MTAWQWTEFIIQQQSSLSCTRSHAAYRKKVGVANAASTQHGNVLSPIFHFGPIKTNESSVQHSTNATLSTSH